MNLIARRPRSGGLRILFVAEQCFPPVRNGSALVYKAWLDALSQNHRVDALLFPLGEEDPADAEPYLREVCRRHLILPGHSPARWLKVVRTLARVPSGRLFAPPAIEELGRGPIQAKIRAFLQGQDYDLCLVSKVSAIHTLGHAIVRELPGLRFLDLHDDFVERERLDRQSLKDSLRAWPELGGYRLYANMRHRYRLSRFRLANARAQEARLLGLFDRILIASDEEHARYRQRPGFGARCRHLPWPILRDEPAGGRPPPARFSAGFIASDALVNAEGLLQFLDRVLPLIRRRRPDFSLLVAGDVGRPLQRLGRSWEGVTLAGRIDELAAFYADTGMALAPLNVGTGVSLKTLEPLDFGRPVVATPIGARGTGLVDGREIVIREGAEGMADAIVALMADPDRGYRLAVEGRRSARLRHAPETVVGQLEEIVAEAQDRRARVGELSPAS